VGESPCAPKKRKVLTAEKPRGKKIGVERPTHNIVNSQGSGRMPVREFYSRKTYHCSLSLAKPQGKAAGNSHRKPILLPPEMFNRGETEEKNKRRKVSPAQNAEKTENEAPHNDI